MDDRVPIEAREEPSDAADLLESSRKAIRRDAQLSFLFGGGIVLLHLVLLIFSVIGLRDIFRSILSPDSKRAGSASRIARQFPRLSSQSPGIEFNHPLSAMGDSTSKVQ
jgi:hypothetical protein